MLSITMFDAIPDKDFYPSEPWLASTVTAILTGPHRRYSYRSLRQILPAPTPFTSSARIRRFRRYAAQAAAPSPSPRCYAHNTP
jgi:hypothetical protein